MALGEQLGGTTGSMAGGIGGKIAGTAIGGPLGGMLGSTIGSSIGGALGGKVGGLFGGGEKEKTVQRFDPAQVARLKEIDRTRKQISEGTDPLTKNAISEIKKTGETTKGQLAKFTGGDVGGTISSFLRAQRGTGKAINDRFNQSQARAPFFENLSTQMGNRIAQRKMELDINAQDTQRAQQAQAQTNRNLNLSGLQASQLGIEAGRNLFAKKGAESNEFSPNVESTFTEGLTSGPAQTVASEGLMGSVGGGTGDIGGGGMFGGGIGGGSLGEGFGGFGS